MQNWFATVPQSKYLSTFLEIQYVCFEYLEQKYELL
jgi:hypothetical protein